MLASRERIECTRKGKDEAEEDDEEEAHQVDDLEDHSD